MNCSRQPISLTLVVLGIAAASSGCVASIEGDALDSTSNANAGASSAAGATGAGAGGPPSQPGTCSNVVEPPPSPLRRLTRTEYDNTVLDLLNDDSQPGRTFPEEGGAGFDNNADVTVVTRLIAQKYQEAAETIAAKAVTDLKRFLGCDPSGSNERVCVQGFVTRFGERAWRRPLAEDEQASMLDLFDQLRAKYDLGASVRTVTEAFLQSPNFLYRVELGEKLAPGGKALELSGFERAARLSYFLWESMPDDSLREAARSNELATADAVTAKAREMLGDPRAKAMVRHFHRQWLMLGDIGRLEKDRATYPGYSEAVGASLGKSMDAFIDHVLWNGDGRIETLLTAPVGFADSTLAKLWGLSGTFGDTPTQVDNAQFHRFGLLSQAPLQAALANPNGTNPIRRGLMVREQLLCQSPPPPPPNVNLTLPAATPTTTTRQRLEQHRASAACAACHKSFDPLGLAFENFDAIGAYREQEGTLPVDATGTLIQSDVDGDFRDGEQLSAMLSKSHEVEECVTKQWFRYAQGRVDSTSDACSVNQALSALRTSNGNVRELIVSLTHTDAFLYRTVPSQEAQQ